MNGNPGGSGMGPGAPGMGPGGHHGGHHGGFFGYGFGSGYLASPRGVPTYGEGAGVGANHQGGAEGEENGINVAPRVMITWKGATVLMTMSILIAGLLLLSNFIGSKIWHIGPIIQDGGVLVFPIIYIASDLLVEIFGKKIANKVAVAAAVLNAVAFVACIVVQLLPGLPNANPTGLYVAYGLSARVTLGSIVAFLASQLYNNRKFEEIRTKFDGENDFWRRALGSSFGAHVIDALLFNVIAFLGRTTGKEFITQTVCAIFVGFIIEIVFNPLATKILKALYKYAESEDDETETIETTEADYADFKKDFEKSRKFRSVSKPLD